jgi:hypothetical protein
MPPGPDAGQATLAHLRGVSRVLDGAVAIPGVGVRVGLDPLIGLVPVVGDWIGGLLAGYIVVRAAGVGVGGATLVRMLGNLAVDLLIGAVPVLGDIFDFAFRANERNLRLLAAHLQDPARRRRSDLAVVVVVAGGTLAIVAGAVALTAWLVARLVGAVAGA